MDNAVALVQSYLHLNGYFTVAEYPILELAGGGPRMATDVDLLALRPPGAGGLVTAGSRAEKGRETFHPDEALAVPTGRADLLIAEVKEGRARLNSGAVDREVLEAVLTRFGQHAREGLTDAVDELASQGTPSLSEHLQVRLVAFGDAGEVDDRGGYRVIPLRLVVERLQAHLEDRWELLRRAQIRDPAFGFLATLKKADGV